MKWISLHVQITIRSLTIPLIWTEIREWQRRRRTGWQFPDTRNDKESN
jgi:hypothetical protein